MAATADLSGRQVDGVALEARDWTPGKATVGHGYWMMVREARRDGVWGDDEHLARGLGDVKS